MTGGLRYAHTNYNDRYNDYYQEGGANAASDRKHEDMADAYYTVAGDSVVDDDGDQGYGDV